VQSDAKAQAEKAAYLSMGTKEATAQQQQQPQKAQ